MLLPRAHMKNNEVTRQIARLFFVADIDFMVNVIYRQGWDDNTIIKWCARIMLAGKFVKPITAKKQ